MKLATFLQPLHKSYLQFIYYCLLKEEYLSSYDWVCSVSNGIRNFVQMSSCSLCQHPYQNQIFQTILISAQLLLDISSWWKLLVVIALVTAVAAFDIFSKFQVLSSSHSRGLMKMLVLVLVLLTLLGPGKDANHITLFVRLGKVVHYRACGICRTTIRRGGWSSASRQAAGMNSGLHYSYVNKNNIIRGGQIYILILILILETYFPKPCQRSQKPLHTYI